jgi:hypothetical protein
MWMVDLGPGHPIFCAYVHFLVFLGVFVLSVLIVSSTLSHGFCAVHCVMVY